MRVKMISTHWLTINRKRELAEYGQVLEVTEKYGSHLVSAGVAVVEQYDPPAHDKKCVLQVPDEPGVARETP